MKTSKAKPFVIAAVLFSAGCVNLFVHAFFIFILICFLLPLIILPRRSEAGRPNGDSRLDWIFGIFLMVAFATVMTLIFVGKMQVPFSVAGRVLCHPAFVISLWLSLMFWLYWRWRRDGKLTDA